jgi:hypothetical protein
MAKLEIKDMRCLHRCLSTKLDSSCLPLNCELDIRSGAWSAAWFGEFAEYNHTPHALTPSRIARATCQKIGRVSGLLHFVAEVSLELPVPVAQWVGSITVLPGP